MTAGMPTPTPPPLPKEIRHSREAVEHTKPERLPAALIPGPLGVTPSKRLLKVLPWVAVVVVLWGTIIYFGQKRSATSSTASSQESAEIRAEPKEKPQHEDPKWVQGILMGFTETLGTREAALAEYANAEQIAAHSNLTVENAIFGLLALSKQIRDTQTRRFIMASMADLASITDRRAFTYRMGILLTEKIANQEQPPRHYFDEIVKLGLRQDFVYACIADKLHVRRRTQQEKNVRIAQMISMAQVEGPLLVQCICEATMRQAGVKSAGSASARTSEKLVE